MLLYIDNKQELEWLAFALGDMNSKEIHNLDFCNLYDRVLKELAHQRDWDEILAEKEHKHEN